MSERNERREIAGEALQPPTLAISTCRSLHFRPPPRCKAERRFRGVRTVAGGGRLAWTFERANFHNARSLKDAGFAYCPIAVAVAWKIVLVRTGIAVLYCVRQRERMRPGTHSR
jgi:hypothetical protein